MEGSTSKALRKAGDPGLPILDASLKKYPATRIINEIRNSPDSQETVLNPPGFDAKCSF